MTAERDTPMIDICLETIACPVHLEPFRDQWPLGVLVAGVKFFQEAAASPEITDITGDDASKLNMTLAEHGPFCRVMDADARLAIYQATAKDLPGFARLGVCAVCKQLRQGTNYSAHQGLHGPIATRHVCFHCVARRECGS